MKFPILEEHELFPIMKVPTKYNEWKLTQRHIIVKFQRTEAKRIFLKFPRGNKTNEQTEKQNK